MDYFIVFGSILLLFLISLGIIYRLMYQLNQLNYELKLGKINCQKDLDRLEDRINQIVNRDNETYKKEIEKLEKLHKSISKMVDEREDEIRITKKLLND